MKQSAGFSLTSPTQLKVTMPDLSVQTISFSGTTVKLNANNITSTDVEVKNFKMVSGAQSVRVMFTLKAVNGTETFSATTTIARRNAL